MLAKIALLSVVFESFWMVPVASASPRLDDLTVKLSKRVTNYNLGVYSFVEALVHVSSEFEIPMGIAWVNTPAAKAEMAFTWKDATVQQVIEAISKTQPGYQVQLRNGVVHVFSPGSIPERENFLTWKIKAFEMHNENADWASRKLHDLITPRKYAGSSMGTTALEITVELKNSSVEDILDALALASDRKIWIVTFSTDPTLTPTGFRRTLA